MNDAALARSFAAQIAGIQQVLLASWHAEDPDAGFTEWAAFRADTRLGFSPPPLDVAALPERRWSEAPILATVGFRLPLPDAPAEAADLWLDGMRRLMARDPVPADRNSFFFRLVELLGLAVGSRAVAGRDDKPARWLGRVTADHCDLLPRGNGFNSVAPALTASCLDIRLDAMSRVEPGSVIDTAYLLWLHLVDRDLAATVTPVGCEALVQQLLEGTAADQPDPHGLGQNGILLITLQRAVAEALGNLKLGGLRAADFVTQLCRRFPLMIAELRNRYNNRPGLEVKDEYDLQDLLRSVLQLHFDDVRAEEWNPSYGGVQSRSDVVLKQERIVIETKMTRKSLTQKELVRQLIQDKEQYRGHPDCGTLIFFVYDPEHRLTNPAAIEHDLSDAHGRPRAIVVVSPRGLLAVTRPGISRLSSRLRSSAHLLSNEVPPEPGIGANVFHMISDSPRSTRMVFAGRMALRSTQADWAGLLNLHCTQKAWL